MLSLAWINGPAPVPSMTPRPRSIAWRTKVLAASTASGKGHPENDVRNDGARQCAAGPVQIARGQRAARRSGERPLRRHQQVNGLVAAEMAAFHEDRRRAELHERRALSRHVCFAARDRLAEEGGRLGEIWRQAIDERQQPIGQIASTKPAPLSASPEEAIITGS